MDKKELKKASDIIRNELASINLKDVEIFLLNGENEELAGDAELFFRKHFEDIINMFIYKQLKFIAEKANGEEQLMFGKGTINGFLLLKEWFEEQVSISLSRFDKKDEPETGEPFS